MRGLIAKLVANEELNFLLTNRIPRRLATNAIGWFSKIEQPLVARGSIAVWRLFSDVDLSDAEPVRYRSMHECFTRRLRPGARTFADGPGIIASPSDAIVGATGRIEAGEAYQIKGAPYAVADLLGDADEAAPFEGGTYVTLRLTAGMYHRFHAPCDLVVEQVIYLSGDCWNVNSAALKRVERLFCRNERVAIRCRLPDGSPLMLVAVAAVLVASVRLSFLDLGTPIRAQPSRRAVSIPITKGEEMGWFEHGSTILVLAPAGIDRLDVPTGTRIKAGEALFRRAG